MLLAICILVAFGYQILSGRTFYVDVVAEKIAEALSSAGDYKISWNSITGNPITGVNFSGVVLTSAGSDLMTADSISLRVALSTLASSSPRMASVTISGLRADYRALSDHLPQKSANASAPAPLDNLYIVDSTLTFPNGRIDISRAELSLLTTGYQFEANGRFNDRDFAVSGRMDREEGRLVARGVNAMFADAQATAEGALTPSMDVICDIKNLDFDIAAELIPSLRNSSISGIYSASFLIKNDDLSNARGFDVSGAISSSGGRLWKFPFQKFASEVKYSGNNINFQGIAADLFSGNITGAANVKLISGKAPNIVVKLDIHSLDTKSMAPEFPWISNFNGIIDNASCNISGFLGDLSGKARFSSPSISAAGFPCKEVSANIDVRKSSVININFLGNIMGSSARGGAAISLANDVTVSADVTLPAMNIESLAGQFPQIKQWNLKGVTETSLFIRGPASNLSYRIGLSSRSLNALDSYNLTEVTAELMYSDDSLAVKSARAKWNEALITTEGSAGIKPNGTTVMSFNGSVSNLNLTRLTKWSDAIKTYNMRGIVSGNWTISGDSTNPASSLDLSIPRLTVGNDVVLSDVRAAVGYKDPRIDIASMSARVGGAQAAASGGISLAGPNKPMEYNIKGSFRDMDPSILAKLGIVSADLSGRFTGDARIWKAGADEPSCRIFFRDSDIKYAKDIDLDGINGTLTYNRGNIVMDHLRMGMNTGNISVSGTVGNIEGWKKPDTVPLDITALITSADIGRLSRIFNPLAHGLQGIVNGTATVKGNAAFPILKADGDLRGLMAFGLFLPVVQLKGITGGANRIDFPNVRAIVGRGVIQASGHLVKSSDWEASVRAEGKSVDIRSLTFSLDNDTRRAITGALDFNFEGDGSFSSFSGKGHAHVPKLSAMGVNLSDADANFSIADGFVIVEDSRADAYGGIARAQVVKDLNLSGWGGRVSVKSADMAPAFKDIFPESTGSITGTTNFTMRFIGDSKRTSMQDGDGNLEILDGEIFGFEGTKSLSKMIGGKNLRFRSANFSFSVDGKTIYILPGSRVSAPREDPVYKYIMLDGSVTTEQEVNLSCIGNVNIRALNALAAGIQGVMSAAVESGGIEDSEALLQNFLGNTITGFARNEFRDVSLKVSGHPGKIAFSNVNIAAPIKANTIPEALREPEGSKEKIDDKMQIKIEFPVGPGGEGHSSRNIGGQVGGQVLDQILKGLIFDD
jgi:uncharacterized protein involved in outer membrane biogenesis